LKRSRTPLSRPNSHSNGLENRKKAVDGYRAIAVILVILSHLDVPRVPGQTGVLFFFVISGYVITSSIIRECSVSFRFSLRNFFLRRAFKLLPPLLLIIILPSFLIVEILDRAALASQAFFYYNWWYLDKSSVGTLDGSQVVWSLSVEEQYYIFIALTVALIFHFFRRSFIPCLIGLYSIVFVYSLISRCAIYYYSNSQNEFGDIFRILYGNRYSRECDCIRRAYVSVS
jgi:peptidoglycan/LPS O-acetylase OafA/YrhL